MQWNLWGLEMKNKLIEVIIAIIVATTIIVGTIESTQPVTSSVQEAPQIGGYPAPEYGYPVITPTDNITLPGYPVMPTPYKIPTGQPTASDYTPAPKMTPTDIIQ